MCRISIYTETGFLQLLYQFLLLLHQPSQVLSKLSLLQQNLATILKTICIGNSCICSFLALYLSSGMLNWYDKWLITANIPRWFQVQFWMCLMLRTIRLWGLHMLLLEVSHVNIFSSKVLEILRSVSQLTASLLSRNGNTCAGCCLYSIIISLPMFASTSIIFSVLASFLVQRNQRISTLSCGQLWKAH